MDELLQFDKLPSEIKCTIFGFLDARTLCQVMSVSHSWQEVATEQTVWRRMLERDYGSFLSTTPLEELSIIPQSHNAFEEELFQCDSVERIFRTTEDDLKKGSTTIISEPERQEQPLKVDRDEWDLKPLKIEGQGSVEPPLMKKRKREFAEDLSSKRFTRDWLEFYKTCRSHANFSGVWVACFGTHGEEFVNVRHSGYKIEAVKITGDPYIPAGKPTFNIWLSDDLTSGEGEIHLADEGYIDPKWGKASMAVTSRDSFDILWPFQTKTHQFVCTLHFKRVNNFIPS